MALTTNLQTAFAVPQTSDRAKRFSSARRHTVLVRVLRRALPLCAFAVCALYVGTILQTVGWVKSLPKVALPNLIPENLAMDNPRYQGFNNDGGSYIVTAKTAVPDITNLSLVTLNGISGELVDAKKVKTKLTAAHGLFNNKSSELELYDGIDIVSESGMRAKLSRATVLTKDSTVFTKEPVIVEMPAGTIKSREMTMRNKSREVTFLNEVTARLTPSAPKVDPAKPKPANSSAAPLLSAGNGPIDITANRLDISDTDRVAMFSGNVRASQAGAALETKTLMVDYVANAEGAASAPGDGTKIRRISSHVPVVMTRAPGDRVTADAFDFDAMSEVAVLTGNVMMTSGSDRQVSGRIATIDQKADTILITGNVVAFHGRNQLAGERLYVDRATGRTQLTSPTATGSDAPGRISTRFYRSEAGGKPGQEWQAALATGPAAGMFKTDPSAPIDVNADRLDLDDKAKTAIYKGDVRAQQADFQVRTAELRAHYTGQAGLADSEPANAAKPAAQLTRIEARGKVIVTSKDGQSATGDWADFDAKGNKVTVGGDVVLTQDKNVVRGTRLLIDMATGKSVIQNDPSGAWTATAAPKNPTTGNDFVVQTPKGGGGRPSAVFYPRDKDKPAAPAVPQNTEKPAQSANGNPWEATGATP